MTTPNLFQLHGKSLNISYSSSGLDGKPHFSYQDVHKSLQFTGDEIRTLETEIGLLVTVNLQVTIDSGSTTFSLLLPNVNLDDQVQQGAGMSAPITTEGITTIHRFSLIPALNRGQTELYSVVQLTGTAQFVLF